MSTLPRFAKLLAEAYPGVEDLVADLPLHPAFAQSWEQLRTTVPVPSHVCEVGLPHTVVLTGTAFAWCAPGR